MAISPRHIKAVNYTVFTASVPVYGFSYAYLRPESYGLIPYVVKGCGPGRVVGQSSSSRGLALGNLKSLYT